MDDTTKKLIEQAIERREKSRVKWTSPDDTFGVMLFSFDGKKYYNFFADYPWNLSQEEREIFRQDEPFWANYFKDRR